MQKHLDHTHQNFIKHENLPFYILSIILITVFFLSAWVADDAYITFRTIDHFWQGYGLRWNIDERVQTYTHPLWMLLLSIIGYPFQELFYSSLALSFICLISMLMLFFKFKNSISWLSIGLLTLLSSKAFVDYTSSGLENPLLHLLTCCLVAYSLIRKEPHLTIISMFFSLFFITRIDSIIFISPILILFIYQTYQKHGFFTSVKRTAAGSLPAIIWLFFAVYYYGSAIPNTAWAKLNHGIGRSQLVGQGLDYIVENIIHDPITLIIIIGGMIFFATSKNKIKKAISIGLFLNIAYLVWIGADYMYGRFLSNLLICVIAVQIFDPKTPPLKQRYLNICSIVTIITIALNTHNWTPNFSQTFITSNGMADERGYYYKTNGLIPNLIYKDHINYSSYSWMSDLKDTKPNTVITKPNIGMFGYLSPNTTHIIDNLALSDPFLAQHPMRLGYWRIGHHERWVSQEYIESVKSHQNLLTTPQEHKILDDIWLLSRAPLNTPARWGAIIRLHTGALRRLSYESFMCCYPHFPLTQQINDHRIWINQDILRPAEKQLFFKH
jgi:arabinofuranosyltransferase